MDEKEHRNVGTSYLFLLNSEANAASEPSVNKHQPIKKPKRGSQSSTARIKAVAAAVKSGRQEEESPSSTKQNENRSKRRNSNK